MRAVPCDLPIVGYGNNVVDTLRIWDAEAMNSFRLDAFDKGDYQKAVEEENLAKLLVEVLYPNDNHMAGKELALKAAVISSFLPAYRLRLTATRESTVISANSMRRPPSS